MLRERGAVVRLAGARPRRGLLSGEKNPAEAGLS